MSQGLGADSVPVENGCSIHKLPVNRLDYIIFQAWGYQLLCKVIITRSLLVSHPLHKLFVGYFDAPIFFHEVGELIGGAIDLFHLDHVLASLFIEVAVCPLVKCGPGSG